MIDLPKMYAWLERDLAAANANRKVLPGIRQEFCNLRLQEVPWLIVYGHRPLYALRNSVTSNINIFSLSCSVLPHNDSYCTDNSIYIIESGSAPSTNTSDPWYGDCTNQAALLRDGIEGFFSIESLLYKVRMLFHLLWSSS